VKELNEALKTVHNQAKEVTDRASEELARAKLIKRGADRDLMHALKSINNLKTQLETVQGERNTLWEAVKHSPSFFALQKMAIEDGLIY
jgi:hypothetical protein